VTDIRLVDGDAVDGASADGAPLDSVRIDGVRIDGARIDSGPVSSAPADSAPVDGELVDNVLDDGASVGSATVGSALPSETPIGNTPAIRAFVDHAPLDGAPIDSAPSGTVPAHKTPAQSAPAQSAPAHSAPTDSATLESPSVDSRPVGSAPVDSPPVHSASRRLAPGAANTLELEPAGAAQVFGDRLALARQFAADLATYGEPLGLIGPLEVGRLWSRHIINCGVVAPFLFANARVADVGSGAGLPGLVLAIARPDVSMTLIEPMERRTDWLRDEVARLGLNNVTVLRARAEDARDAGPFDQVTARAVSALAKLIPLTAALLRPGGELILLKGSRVADEIGAAAAVLRRHRVSNIEVRELGQGIVPEVTRLFRATVGGAS